MSPERERGSNRDKSNRDLEAVKSALCPAGTKSYILTTTGKKSVVYLKSPVFGLIHWALAENLVGLGFLQSVSYIKSILNQRKNICCGKKKWPEMLLSACFFLGLGWPWVGEFVGFMMTFICFPTQQHWYIANVLIHKHP